MGQAIFYDEWDKREGIYIFVALREFERIVWTYNYFFLIFQYTVQFLAYIIGRILKLFA